MVTALLVPLFVPAAQTHAQTPAAMGAHARADFARADADLNKTYQAVLAKLRDTESKQKLKETQRGWIASRDAEAARAAKEAEGGSMAATIRYETMTDLTRKRITELKAMIDNGTAASKRPSNISTPTPTSKPESQPEETQSASETEHAPSSSSNSVSPDKNWQYVAGDRPKLVKTGTSGVALEFLDQCDLGAVGEDSRLLWAPDSKRLAFYSCGAGKEHNTLLYQLRDDRWVTLEGPRDELFDRAGDITEAQAKRKGLPKGTFLHMLSWKVEPRQWLDSSTLVVYASMAEVVHRNDGEYVGPGYGADFLVTLKFDDAGNWKIVKTREMTGKAAESPSASSPLADEVLYRSPQGTYQIQASADGTALWIVPTNDPNQRKPLPGADPDNRSPEEFSASPDESWLFDDRKPELYRDTGDLAFAEFNKKQWLWKNALDYASKEFHLPRRQVSGESAGWSCDSARLLIHFETNPNFEADPDATPQHRFVYFNTRTKAFEQTPYLRMVNAKLQTEKPWEAFPEVAFTGERLGSYVVFVEPIDPPPSEAALKPRSDALDHEMNALREKELADLATRSDKSIVEFRRRSNDEWNKAREEAVQLYVPFAPKDQQDARKLQFLCDLTQREVNGLKEH